MLFQISFEEKYDRFKNWQNTKVISATYRLGPQNRQYKDKIWKLFLNIMMEQTLSSLMKGDIYIIEKHLGIVLESLMKIDPDEIREKVQVAFVENYYKNLLDD